MVTITTEQLKSEPDKFIQQLESGQEVVILHDSHFVGRAVPSSSAPGRPLYGSSSGKIILADDFDAPLSDFAEYQ